MKNFSGKPALLQHIAAAHPKGSGGANAGGKLLAVKDGAAGCQAAAVGGGAEEKQLVLSSSSSPSAQVLRKRPTKQEEQRIRAMWRDWCDSKIAQCEYLILTKRLPKRFIRISKTHWNQMKSDPSKYVSKSLEEVQEAMREIDEEYERAIENMDSDSD
jgi:hypothetical protein